jgi:type I restriction enzyme S subunit
MSGRLSTKTTEVGAIPEDWEVAEIGSSSIIKAVKAGGTPLRTRKEYYENGNIPFVRIEDITQKEKFLTDTKLKITKYGLDNSSAWIVPENSVLFSMYASFGEAVINRVPVATNQAIIALVPEDTADTEFLYYSLKNLKSLLRMYLRETTQKNLNSEIVKNLKIPLPASIERRKIALILSTVDTAIQKTEGIIAKTQHLKKGLMRQLLTTGIGHTQFKQTEIGKVPEEWKVSIIGSECEVGTGGTPSRTKPEYYLGHIPWVKTTEVNYKTINATAEHITEQALAETSAKMYPRGTLLIAMYGQGITRGKCAILGIDAAINQACAAIASLGRVHIPFLFYWFQMNYSKLRSMGQGANQANFNLKLVRSVRIPVPSVDEQKEISSILTEVDDKIEAEHRRKATIDQLKKGLMQVLLTGKVRARLN